MPLPSYRKLATLRIALRTLVPKAYHALIYGFPIDPSPTAFQILIVYRRPPLTSSTNLCNPSCYSSPLQLLYFLSLEFFECRGAVEVVALNSMLTHPVCKICVGKPKYKGKNGSSPCAKCKGQRDNYNNAR
jgi:hypothetical protein